MGVLPFLTTGRLQDQGGAPVNAAQDVPLSLWPARATNTPGGRAYDYEAQVHPDYADQLRVGNRQLEVDGTVYRITHVEQHQLALPHVHVELRRVGA